MNLAKAKKFEDDGKYDKAIIEYKKAYELNPKNHFLQVEIGNLYALQNNFEEASGYFRRANRFFPDNKEIINGLIFCLNAIANEYHNLNRFDLAEAALEEALSLDERRADILYNSGNACYAQKKFKKALLFYQKSIALEKNSDIHNNLANTYRNLGNLTKAKVHYIESLSLKKNIPTLVELTHLKQNICDWSNLDNYQSEIADFVINGQGKISPFTVLSMPNFDQELQLKTSNLWLKQYQLPPFTKKTNKKNKKINIGYLSADFRKHPTHSLIFDILKLHNPEDFEIKLFYSGSKEESIEYKDYRNLPHSIYEVEKLSDIELASLIEREKIDILVDLSGFTRNSRSIISALRPAKFHINWLGFPGSLGYFNSKPLCDFIIADNFVIPENYEKFYAEKIIKIEGCYQPNIRNRTKLKKISKIDYGFKSNDFIFGSFGQSIKISQIRFDSWLKILSEVPNSKLWLLESNLESSNNLWSYAKNKGIDSKRIKFASKVKYSDHINRHQIIDLFIDTYPYNAHTSTSDALWASCPVLTLAGSTFPSRVAGSILNSIECDELICKSEDEYVKKAVFYAKNPIELKKIKEKIKDKKENSNLFKPEIFTSRLEKIYKSLISC